MLAPFEWLTPTTLEEAVELLAERGESCKVLAGGTDLLVEMHGSFESSPCLLDIKGLSELQELSFSPRAGTVIGALVTHHALDRSPEIRRWYPALWEGASQVGSVQIRHRGTIGGNICNAVPSGDTLGPLLALDARAEITGPGGTRTMALRDFFLGPKKTALTRGELLTKVLLPPPAERAGSAYLKFTRRGAMDLALLGASAAVALDDGGTCVHARVALTTAAPTPFRAVAAEEYLNGKPLEEGTLREAGRIAAREARPRSSWRASEAYRRDVLEELVPRIIATACHRAERGEGTQ